MQTLIVSVILVFASAYLAWRWMPKSAQKTISGWIARRAPALSPYLQASAGGCSSGCSSCGNSNADNTGCDTAPLPKTSSQGRPVIQIRPQ
ncbi:MAG: hypothetical protein V4634_04485 [Pseudomonadota bacterium]